MQKKASMNNPKVHRCLLNVTAIILTIKIILFKSYFKDSKYPATVFN